MKKILFSCIICCLGFLAQSQRVYFIYLQSEGSTPFYVKMGDKVFSSSTEGYLILPNLKDSTYSFMLGQTGKNKEVQFNLTVNKTDKGYLIKTVDNNLVLFDLQTLSLTKPVVFNTTSSGTVAKTDHFTKLLAKAADDSSLLYQVVFTQPEKVQPREPEIVVEEKKPVEEKKEDVVAAPQASENTVAAPIAKVDTAVATEIKQSEPVQQVATAANVSEVVVAKKEEDKTPIVETAVTEQPVKNDNEKADEEYKRSVVEKKSESSTSEGFGLVFWDRNEGTVDTIRITIPNPKIIFNQGSEQAVADSVNENKKENSAEEVTVNPRKANCSATSTDDDFFKLRRDMAGEKNDEAMLAQANKYFRSKCFRTEQIKYLSTLFLTEPSKYQFFDLAFMHVSDQERFDLLQAELKDPYYINRFKALIAK